MYFCQCNKGAPLSDSMGHYLPRVPQSLQSAERFPDGLNITMVRDREWVNKNSLHQIITANAPHVTSHSGIDNFKGKGGLHVTAS